MKHLLAKGHRMKHISFLFVLLLAACSTAPSPAAIQITNSPLPISTETQIPTSTYTPTTTSTASLTATNTRWPTKTPTRTEIPSPTFTRTPKNTLLPTNTKSPTLTPVPFSKKGCVKFQFKYTQNTSQDEIGSQLMQYVNKCVQLIYYEHENEPPLFIGYDYFYSVKAHFIQHYIPLATPKSSGTVWGILDIDGNTVNLHLGIFEPFTPQQTPKVSPGTYTVDENGDMAPGLWKSSIPNWRNDSCYWERLDPTTGEIRDNHFGIPGVTVRVYAGDVFNTKSKCGNWFYIGP